MPYYAHTIADPKTKQNLPRDHWQLLREHLKGVEVLAGRRASKFGAEKLGRIIGLAHDLGKYSKEFQLRLTREYGKVDHSTAGAQELYKRYGKRIGKAIAYTVAGHHGGIPDGVAGSPANLPERLAKEEIAEYKAFIEEIEIPTLNNEDLMNMPQGTHGMEAFSFSFCIRMLFSCLVDADFLDTERFMNIQRYQLRPEAISIQQLLARFEKKIAELENKNKSNPTTINKARQEILERCLQKSESEPGFFTLTVPTGGGKTYSSLAFGLRHAVKFNKERIIYVVPYTSIIEQNAQVFRDALGNDNVILEHHSTFEYSEGNFEDWDNHEKTHRLASENWDMPIVVTTAVQFFESLYANKSSRCRKLHNLTNSVIILDEAQLMPIEYMRPCLWALAELVINYGASVVFCTATQPAIKELIPGGLEVVEIMDNPSELHNIFKRVEVQYVEIMSDEELAKKMTNSPQVLTILNTRKHARLLFDKLALNGGDGIFHLSARMCPAHRKEILAEIRQKLKCGSNCRVVSTQLIEAGVDVDFPVVFRSATGIDSIAQAAGRCNREGRLLKGIVTVFEPESHGMPSKGHFNAVAALTRSTVRKIAELNNDLLSLEAIEYYFRQLLDLNKDDLDKHKILSLINVGSDDISFPFEKVAKEFQLIDSQMFTIVVPWDEYAMKLMDEVEKSRFPASKTRMLQPYAVQVYSHELAALEKEGVIKTIDGVIRFLTDSSFYDQQFGLKDAKEVKAPKEVLIF